MALMSNVRTELAMILTFIGLVVLVIAGVVGQAIDSLEQLLEKELKFTLVGDLVGGFFGVVSSNPANNTDLVFTIMEVGIALIAGLGMVVRFRDWRAKSS